MQQADLKSNEKKMHHYIKAVKQLKKTVIYQISQVIISIMLIVDTQFSKIKQLSNIWWWFGGLVVVEETTTPLPIGKAL